MGLGSKTVSLAAAAVMTIAGAYLPAAGIVPEFDEAITASAAQVVTPSLRAGAECGDKLILYIDNYRSFSDSAEITVRVSGNRFKPITGQKLKSANGKLSFTSNGKKYLKPYTRYRVNVTVSDGGATASSEIKITTSKNAFYSVKSGTDYYTLTGGTMRRQGTLSSSVCRGVLTDARGNSVKGIAVKDTKAEYVKLMIPVKTSKNSNNEQLYSYKYVYVKTSDASRKSVDSIRSSVANYAVKMSNVRDQKYVLCGETMSSSVLRSDCSGLTKAGYLKVGCYLEHIADSQANMSDTLTVYDNLVRSGSSDGVTTYRLRSSSSRVDLSALRKGDLLFFLCSTNNQSTNPTYINDGIGHVGMYVGDGKFVHFTSSYGVTNHPCRVENLRSYESSQLPVVRVVRVAF